MLESERCRLLGIIYESFKLLLKMKKKIDIVGKINILLYASGHIT